MSPSVTVTGLGRTEEIRLSEPVQPQRRRFLQAAALGSIAGLAGGVPARATTVAAPHSGVDTVGASPELVAFMTAFFDAKTARDVDATMAFFSPDLVTYIDAVLGWDLAGYDAVRDIFEQYMPNWPDTARSYPTRIVGDMQGGAFVAFTDTPELFGGELRLLAALDFRDGRILRWIDHWDSRDWPNAYGLAKSPLTDYREVEVAASPAMRSVSETLFAAFAAGRADAMGDVLSEDVVLEDMALRSQLLGRTAVLAYLDRALPALPYGTGAAVRHVTGSDGGGAIEWTAAASAPVRTGVTGILLDADGRVARLTTVYDGGLYEREAIAPLAAAVLNI